MDPVPKTRPDEFTTLAVDACITSMGQLGRSDLVLWFAACMTVSSCVLFVQER
jgi:hypothetical protein